MQVVLWMILLIFSSTVFAQEEEDQSPKKEKLFEFKFSLNELTYIDIGNEFELSWQIAVRNKNQEKFEFGFTYSEDLDRQTDNFSNQEISDLTKDLNLNFDINNIWGRLGLTSELTAEQIEENDRFQTRYDIHFSPIGVKLDLFENSYIKDLNISYLPQYAYLDRFDFSEDFDGNEIEERSLQRSFVHTFILGIELAYKHFSLRNKSLWRFNDSQDNDLEHERELNFRNTLTLSANLSKSFSASLEWMLDWDESREERQGLPSTNRQITWGFDFIF